MYSAHGQGSVDRGADLGNVTCGGLVGCLDTKRFRAIYTWDFQLDIVKQGVWCSMVRGCVKHVGDVRRSEGYKPHEVACDDLSLC
jgi:hypothetical protein